MPFVSSPGTVRRSRPVREGLHAAAPAIGCCTVTCRSRSTTLQTARKMRAHAGCDIIARSRWCAPRHRSPGYDLRRASCGRHRLTVREAPVRRRCHLAAPAIGCYAVTCRGEYPDFVCNAAHGGLDQRFHRQRVCCVDSECFIRIIRAPLRGVVSSAGRAADF